MEDDLFLFRIRVGDDRCTAHFGPCARSCRHSNNRGNCICVCAGPPIADVFKIPKRAVCPAKNATNLPRSRPEPPPKAINAVMPAIVKALHLQPRSFRSGSGQHLRTSHGQGPQPLADQVSWCDVHLRQATVRHKQRLFDSSTRAGLCNFRNTASAKTDCGRVGPVCSDAHGAKLSSCGKIWDVSGCDSR